MKLNLKANNANEQRVLDYLEANASEVLAEKINGGNKTLKGFFVYARGEAQKLAVNGCACVEDRTVFGWAIHYFEEEEIKEPTAAKKAKATESTKAPVKAKKDEKPSTRTEKTKKPEDKPVSGQISLFDSLFGGVK